eukprot:1925456-Amphidinium_carterae.1
MCCRSTSSNCSSRRESFQASVARGTEHDADCWQQFASRWGGWAQTRQRARCRFRSTSCRGTGWRASAVQLAMLETLERLSGTDRRGREGKGETLEELLFGSGDDAGASTDSNGRLGGVKGVVGMQRIAQSIDSDPERWSLLFDQSVYRALGADLTGAPWSVHRYGLEKVNFGKHADLRRFWFLLAALHALHRGGEMSLLGARIAQFLKALEVAVAMNGNWTVAWTLTGIANPDPTSSIHGGLATPLEVATAIAFVKDTRVLEEAARKTNAPAVEGGTGQGNGCRTWTSWWSQRKRRPRKQWWRDSCWTAGVVWGGSSTCHNEELFPPSDQVTLPQNAAHIRRPKLVQRALRCPQDSIDDIENGILDYFSKRVVPKNPKRENIKADGEGANGYARSLLLGLYTVRGTGLSRATRAHWTLVQLCHRLAAARPPSLRCRYVAMMINDNPHVCYHRDINNCGLSMLRSFGAYTGGEFHQQACDALLGVTPSAANRGQCGVSFVTKQGWMVFDACIPHGVSLVSGRRLSIAYFMPVRHDHISAELTSELRRFGFPLDLPMAMCESFVHQVPCFVHDDTGCRGGISGIVDKSDAAAPELVKVPVGVPDEVSRPGADVILDVHGQHTLE